MQLLSALLPWAPLLTVCVLGCSASALLAQLRMNIRVSRAEVYSRLSEMDNSLLEHVYANEDTCRFYHHVMSGGELDGAQQLRWHCAMIAIFRHWDNVYIQHRSGVLSRTLWRGYRYTLLGYARYPAWSEWFRENQQMFSPGLVRLFLAEVDRVSDEERRAAGERWKMVTENQEREVDDAAANQRTGAIAATFELQRQGVLRRTATEYQAQAGVATATRWSPAPAGQKSQPHR